MRRVFFSASLFVLDTLGDTLPRLGNGFMLRRLASDDLPEFQAYRHDPELGRYQGWSPMSDDEATAFLREMSTAPLFNSGGWTQIAIADPDSGLLIGDIGVFLAQDGRHAEVGFTLARHAQGRGVAAAAVRDVVNLIFDATEVDRVVGITDARNSASVRLLERVGMRRTEVKNVVFRGEQCVEYIYAVLRDDV
jgi:RimJ/RimL family protein N-acetyltransferase